MSLWHFLTTHHSAAILRQKSEMNYSLKVIFHVWAFMHSSSKIVCSAFYSTNNKENRKLLIPQNVRIDTKKKNYMLNVGKINEFYNHLRGDVHISGHVGFQSVMKTCFLSFITTSWQLCVRWHHNGCRYHIETTYEMKNCTHAPAMSGCIASIALLAAILDCICWLTSPV